MIAVGIPEYGDPGVISLVELPVPEPGENEIRIRITDAVVGPADLSLLAGNYAAFTRGPPPWVGGTSAAGTVDAIGPGATWRVGDEVIVHVGRFPHCRGAHAEYVVVHADQAGPAPSGISSGQASTLPVVGLTAMAALDAASLTSGQTLAVTGAAGGVGSAVVQLAAARGICVVGTAAAADEARVRELGARDFVTRETDDMAASIRAIHPDGVDALIDSATIGGPALAAIRDGGTYVDLTGMGIESERGIAVAGVMIGRDHLMCRDRLASLSRLAEQGELDLKVAATLPPVHGPEAYRMVRDGPGSHGRVVISFS